jgi:ribonuclease Z
MTIRNDIIDNFRGFSMAMYSTWLWHKPSRSMFDAGEGISPTMRNHIFAIENVFLTHGHHDHVGGLAGLALARGAARGDKTKPFSVYHPGGWDKIEALKAYIRSAAADMDYQLHWVEVRDGDCVPVSDDGKTFVRAFRVNHSRRGLCLGYAMVEKRVRLRKEFAGLEGREIAAIVNQKGRDAINEPYEKIVFAYAGDCTPVAPDSVRGAEVLFHEGTFVGDEDMDPEGGHSTVRGAVESAVKAGVGLLVVCHVSTRYSASDAGAEARKVADELGFAGGIRVLDGARMISFGGQAPQSL